jgi:hypothetical protein
MAFDGEMKPSMFSKISSKTLRVDLVEAAAMPQIAFCFSGLWGWDVCIFFMGVL